MNNLITSQRAIEIAKVFKALGHPVRTRIVFDLLERECNVKHMTERLHVPQAGVSQQLAVLRAAGVVEYTRKGNQVCYRVSKPWLRKLVRTIAASNEEL